MKLKVNKGNLKRRKRGLPCKCWRMKTTKSSKENGRNCSIHLAICCISYLWYEESLLFPLPEEVDPSTFEPLSSSLSPPSITDPSSVLTRSFSPEPIILIETSPLLEVVDPEELGVGLSGRSKSVSGFSGRTRSKPEYSRKVESGYLKTRRGDRLTPKAVEFEVCGDELELELEFGFLSKSETLEEVVVSINGRLWSFGYVIR